MIKFAYTILYVKDVRKTLDFYKNAFGLEERFISEDASYGELDCGETTLSFASLKLAATNLSGGFIESNTERKPFAMEIGFSTDDVEATVTAALKAGGKLAEKPKTKPWGQVVAYVRDPDGFLVEICTPMG
jgi:lactoylglutathione lyase